MFHTQSSKLNPEVACKAAICHTVLRDIKWQNDVFFGQSSKHLQIKGASTLIYINLMMPKSSSLICRTTHSLRHYLKTLSQHREILHWLRVPQQIQVKLFLLTYKSQHSPPETSSYRTDLLHRHTFLNLNKHSRWTLNLSWFKQMPFSKM